MNVPKLQAYTTYPQVGYRSLDEGEANSAWSAMTATQQAAVANGGRADVTYHHRNFSIRTTIRNASA